MDTPPEMATTGNTNPKLQALTWLAGLLLLAVIALIVVSLVSSASQREALNEVREAVEANTAAVQEIKQDQSEPAVLHSYADECSDRGGSQTYVIHQSLRVCNAGWRDSFSIPHDRDWDDEYGESYYWSPPG
ncbi:MAG: hypothetical protein OXG30_10955 [bacterium]|nr:hypothetical protein [bacterium]